METGLCLQTPDDFLIRSLLENAGIQDTLGITDNTDARFAIEPVLVRHPSDRFFSSHSRPHFEGEGIARWMLKDTDAPYLMIQGQDLVEYDEKQDTYAVVSSTPSGPEPSDESYSTHLTDESSAVLCYWIREFRHCNRFHAGTRVATYGRQILFYLSYCRRLKIELDI